VLPSVRSPSRKRQVVVAIFHVCQKRSARTRHCAYVSDEVMVCYLEGGSASHAKQPGVQCALCVAVTCEDVRHTSRPQRREEERIPLTAATHGIS